MFNYFGLNMPHRQLNILSNHIKSKEIYAIIRVQYIKNCLLVGAIYSLNLLSTLYIYLDDGKEYTLFYRHPEFQFLNINIKCLT
jgi:hypothetical protein